MVFTYAIVELRIHSKKNLDKYHDSIPPGAFLPAPERKGKPLIKPGCNS